MLMHKSTYRETRQSERNPQGTVFLTMFATGLMVGLIGTFYAQLGAARFWLLQAAISSIGIALVLAMGRSLNGALEPQPT